MKLSKPSSQIRIVLQFIFLFFFVSCASSEKESKRPVLVPAVSCSQGPECGVVGAVGAIGALAQMEKSETPPPTRPGKNNILIRCRYSQKNSEITFPCAATQIRMTSERSEPTQLVGSGEEIRIPDLKPLKIYNLEITQRNCPAQIINGLRVGDSKEVVLLCP